AWGRSPHCNKGCAAKGGGFTLLEVVIAFGLWLILSMGIFLIWQYSVNSGTRMLERQNVFENARGTMDVLTVNIQQAGRINILNDGEILRTLYTFPHGSNDPTRIHFIPSQEIVSIGLRSASNELTSNIADVRVVPTGEDRLRITVTAICINCEEECPLYCSERVILENSVCTRHKCVNSCCL
ncbi:MAG: type II secretion system GspH family protein, partial [Defluviitaleaceae bacterium]|nr:type II secretion system GspH family protein [Defluviitaleaceae bacterium]